ncbi:acyl-CoA synthetase [Microbacterium sp. SLBN-146]|uniref:acyl-CoA synthetase n=1 Tax=Microbacterium sp. SLBN-146 TaxID=2768457 RepID=UPI00114E0E84|nr:acyl-CoA synthetase [Microbacterium sp. SLBN-146]TQJ30300.1 hypothetical protein FBY39_0747 [Microbacterium sp. SLBN-146]
MTSAPSARTFEVRHVQLARAAFAAIAAVMITFSPDHSAAVGLAVFSGFAIATGLVLLLSVWLVYPAGVRWPAVLLGIVTVGAGMVSGLGPVRETIGFFAVVITWAVIAGVIELVAGIVGIRSARPRTVAVRPGEVAPWSDGTPRTLMPRGEARDAIVIGAVGLVLALGLLLVQPGYALDYTIEEADATYTLTGITIAVGLFGAYAAIVAVYLGIAGFSPRTAPASQADAPTKESA